MFENMKKITSQNLFGAGVVQMNLQINKDNVIAVTNNTNNNSPGNGENYIASGSHHINGCNTNNVSNHNGTEAGTDEATNDVLCMDEILSVTTNSHSDKSCSIKDSTDNLSLLSDTDVVEELLLIQDTISDEEISINSDDCVYAYRGADFESPELRNNVPEDETDFLEMDFDPDPASELDNTNECQDYNRESNTNNISNLSKLNNEPQQIDVSHKINIQQPTMSPRENQSQPLDGGSIMESLDVSSNKVESHKTTGTKPKKIFDKQASALTSMQKIQKPLKMNGNLDIVIHKNETTISTVSPNNRRSDETCLDCLEKEFLSKSFGRNIEPFECRKCKFKLNDNKKQQNNHLGPESFYESALDDCLKYEDFMTPLKKIDQRLPSCSYVDEEKLNELTNANTCSFPSTHADEYVIAQAFEKLNVKYDKEVLRQELEAIGNKTIFKDVTEFILYMSKRNCDYKKIIKAIENASKDKLEITYRPNDNYCNDEVVRVNAYDILKAWTPKNDLRKLKCLDKRFLQMNILGKVLNVIRQAQQRNLKALGDDILIPQYYKTGSIYVARK